MKVKCNVALKTLSGETFKDGVDDLLLGLAIANCLSYSEVGGKMKCFDLAKKFYSQKVVEIDASDLKLVKDIVEKNKIYTNNVLTGSILSLLEEVKEDKDDNK